MTTRQRNILIVLGLALIFLLIGKKDKAEYLSHQGYIFGTSYSIIYESPQGESYGVALHQHLMDVVDQSLSTFNDSSIISLVNKNMAHETDSAFERVFLRAQELSVLTEGAFDMTVAPLVNAWGFGYEGKDKTVPMPSTIDSLLGIVGYKTVALNGCRVEKQYAETKPDGSAIAKGYGVDVAAEYLASKGVSNYMVEIGGEIRVLGRNKFGNKWRLGVDKPLEDPQLVHRDIDTIIHLSQGALATSGNYRQYYYKEGKRYSHTIDPKTGYPVNHHLLSATVIAPDCMTADALATACMVMGEERSLAMAEDLPGVELYLIVAEQEAYRSSVTSGMHLYLKP